MPRPSSGAPTTPASVPASTNAAIAGPAPATPGAGARSKLPSLTSLRFFAALIVFLYHASMANGPLAPYGPLSPFANGRVATDYASVLEDGGYVGVSFFFVLSGFVLTWSASLAERKTAFWRRRVLKIFPNHLVLWAVAMALFAASTVPAKAWVPSIFLINSFWPQPYIFATVNMPSWTLCSELLFYALFPLLLRPVARIGARRLWIWAGAMVAGMVGIQLVNVFLIPGTPTSPYLPGVSIHQQWFGYIFPPTRLFEFVLGMLLARIVRAGLWPRIGVLPAVALMFGGLLLAHVVPTAFAFEVATVVPVAVLICAAAASDVAGRRSVLGTRVMVWLGEVSFAFYMCQGVVLFYGRIKITHNHQYGTPTAVGVLLAFLAANLVAGWLLYSFVERPIMQRWARSRKRPALVSVPTPTVGATLAPASGLASAPESYSGSASTVASEPAPAALDNPRPESEAA